MGDLRFALSVIITILGGYFNRDDDFEAFLERYNDELPDAGTLKDSIYSVLEFIDECGFGRKSRAWRKADIFTLLIETYVAKQIDRVPLDPSAVVSALQDFYDDVDAQDLSSQTLSGIYYKAALQASNDRLNRVRRGIIIGGLLRSLSRESILEILAKEGLSPS